MSQIQKGVNEPCLLLFFRQRFSEVPVSINNLYGDPFLPTQIEDTFLRLEALKNTKHNGFVSIITKSEIDDDITQRLFEYTKHLKLILIVSVSGLSKKIEPVKGNRLNTLLKCNNLGIPCIAYLRPFIPGENTSTQSILELFKKIKNTGTNNVIISGLRGNDEILKNLNFSVKEMEQWSLRVKTIPKEVGIALKEAAKATNVRIFNRTSCGVVFTLKEKRSYNPYFASPLLAGCNDCPLNKTCFSVQNEFQPTKEDIELLKFIGYDVTIVHTGNQEICHVIPENRKKCESCCTSCFKLKREAIEIKSFSGICLGDISLARLLTHKHVFCKNLIDSGEPTIAQPKNPLLKDKNLYLLNSWWSYSRNTPNCYGCSYCIVPMFGNENKAYGMPPLDFLDLFLEERKIR